MTHPHDPGSRNCREVFSRLSEYLDGELPENLCDGIVRHLGDCPPCQAFLQSLRRTVDWIRSDAPAPLPDDVRRSIREAYRLYREGERD